MENWSLPHVFSFNGQEVRYGVAGSGQPLVLIHGTPFSSVVWRRIAPLLAAGRRVYFYDLLGYGQSEKRIGQDVSLGIQNGVLRQLLQHWNVTNPDVIAHDLAEPRRFARINTAEHVVRGHVVVEVEE
jgi:pimeloyl-ACP methyl ester carboxylesterase